MHGVGLLCRHSQRSHDLSDEDIRPALTLRHQKIAQFSERYGVNREWLLAGTGRIFKTDPIEYDRERIRFGGPHATCRRAAPDRGQASRDGEDKDIMKRCRRSHSKPNRQRVATFARRLRR